MAVQDALGGVDKAADQRIRPRSIAAWISARLTVTQELLAYPHKLVDIRDPLQSYSAAEFVADADAAIQAALEAQKKPLVVGGTMMYLKCLIEGIADLPSTDDVMRDSLAQELEQRGGDALHAELAELDPQAAANIHPNNHQRLLRALAVIRVTGGSLTGQWQQQASGTLSQRLGVDHRTMIMMPADRTVLHKRIATRFSAILSMASWRRGQCSEKTCAELPSTAVGYRQAWRHLNGEIDAPPFCSKASRYDTGQAPAHLARNGQMPRWYPDNAGDAAPSR